MPASGRQVRSVSAPRHSYSDALTRRTALHDDLFDLFVQMSKTSLDKIPIGTYTRAVLFMRGASRGVFEVEQDTAPAALPRKQDSGGRGSASGLTMKPCHWLADAGQAEAAQAAMPRAFQTDARTSPKARSPARNRRRWSAAKRCAARIRVSQPGWSRRHTPHVAPCGAPSPLNSEGAVANRGRPRAVTTTGALAHVCA